MQKAQQSPFYRKRNKGSERDLPKAIRLRSSSERIPDIRGGSGEGRDSHIGGEDPVDEVLLRQVEGTLQLVVVEGDLTRAGAVEPGLHERGPSVLQQEPAPHVILAHAGHPRVHGASTVMLHRILPQQEVCEQPDIIGCYKVWLWGQKRNKGWVRPGGRKGQSWEYSTTSISSDGYPDNPPPAW